MACVHCRTFREGLHVNRRDEPHVPELRYRATPDARTVAGFHDDDAGWQLAEKLQNLSAPQLLAQDRPISAVGPMHLERNLCQVEPHRTVTASKPSDP